MCLILSRVTFDYEASGVWPLMNIWGGEAIYWDHDRDSPIYRKLRTTGTPSIVAVNLSLCASEWNRHNSQGLLRLFAGRLLGIYRTTGEVFSPRPVAAADVVAVWQPGDDDYDCHMELDQPSSE